MYPIIIIIALEKTIRGAGREWNIFKLKMITKTVISKYDIIKKSPLSPLYQRGGLPSLWQREVRRDFTIEGHHSYALNMIDNSRRN